MSLPAAVLTLVLLAAVIFVISGPLRTARRGQEPEAAERRELLSAREAKYREIRDTELDYRTGKLSQEDFEIVNGALRVEASDILKRLEALERVSSEEVRGDGEEAPSG
jgi:hypothetical protein